MERISNIINTKGCLCWGILIFSIVMEFVLAGEPIGMTICCISIILCVKSIKKNADHEITPHKRLEYSNTFSIDAVKIKAESENNVLKKKVLNSIIGSLTQKQAEYRLTPRIQTCEKKLAKKRIPELELKLQQYKDELQKAQETAKSLCYDIIGELSDDEKDRYATFCESFKRLCNSKKTWIITKKIQCQKR